MFPGLSSTPCVRFRQVIAIPTTQEGPEAVISRAEAKGVCLHHEHYSTPLDHASR